MFSLTHLRELLIQISVLTYQLLLQQVNEGVLSL